MTEAIQTLMKTVWIASLTLAMTVVMISQSHAQQCDGALSRGLVGHWKLDETSGTFADSSGNGNDGTQSGGVSYGSAGVLGKAASFDGVDDNISIADPGADSLYDFAAGETITLAVWVKPDTVSGGYINIFGKGAGFTNYYLERLGDDMIFFYYDGSAYQEFNAPNLLQAGIWQHFTVTYTMGTGSSLKMYLNGNEVSGSWTSGSGNTAPVNDNNPLYIGSLASSQYWNGQIDDVRIYNRGLTAAEVKSLYNLNAGAMRYNAESSAMEYCDGENWVMTGTGSYSPTAVDFDGVNDHLAGVSNPPSDEAKGTISVWFKPDTESIDMSLIQIVDGRFTLGYDQTLGNLLLRGENSADVQVLRLENTVAGLNVGEWTHALASWDLSLPVPQTHLYINNADQNNEVMATSGEQISFTHGPYNIGARNSGAIKWDGAMADFWFDAGTYIDFSSATQRSKFISPSGAPMYLGPDGSLPTGSSPDIFLSGDVDTWHINKGTGGGFTENGELTYSSVNPGSPYAEMTDNGLVGWWKLDETSGTTLIDASGNNNATYYNFSMGGAQDVESGLGIIGRSAQFYNKKGYLGDNASFNFSGTNALSISAWIKPDGSSGGSRAIFMRGRSPDAFSNNANRAYYFGLYGADNDRLQATLSNGTNHNTLLADNAVDFDIWQQVAMTWDGTNLILYKNGALLNQVSGAFALWDDPAEAIDRMTSIGGNGRNDNDTNFFRGSIDDVRVYNRALSQPEIQAIYDAAFCTGPSGKIGDMIFNTDESVMQYCTGKDWVAMGPVGGTGGSGCGSPSGNAGDLMFNDDFDVMQFCNGNDWVGMGKQPPPSVGLVGHWRLDEGSGNFIDSAGSNDGTPVGGVAFRSGGSAKLGFAAGFGADDDSYINIPDPAGGELDFGTGAFTFSAWAKPKGFISQGSGLNSILSKRNNPSPTASWDISLVSGNDVNCQIDNVTITLGTLDLDEWHHIVCTRDDSGNFRGFLNGSLAASGLSAGDVSNTYPVRIGSGITIRDFWGHIDDVRIYNRALDPSEARQLYYATK